MIYFIRGGGMVKIGVAGSVRERLALLQTGSPVKLAVIRTIEGGKLVEAWLHECFAPSRSHGEWFEYSERMLSIEPPADLLAADDAKSSAREAEWRSMEQKWWSSVIDNDEGLPAAEYLDQEYQKWVKSPAGHNFFNRMRSRQPRGGVGRQDEAQAAPVVLPVRR